MSKIRQPELCRGNVEIGSRHPVSLSDRMCNFSTKLPILKSKGVLSSLSSKVDPYIIELEFQHIDLTTSIYHYAMMFAFHDSIYSPLTCK